MRLAMIGFGTLVAILAAGVQPSSAADWCNRDGTFGSGSWDCSYHTFRQCLASSSGVGGTCEKNPWLLWQERQSGAPNAKPQAKTKRTKPHS